LKNNYILCIIICRIEEEEVDAYSTFDQNNDGIVSQDEKDVSSFIILKMKILQKLFNNG